MKKYYIGGCLATMVTILLICGAISFASNWIQGQVADGIAENEITYFTQATELPPSAGQEESPGYNNTMVGGKPQSACQEQPDLQIEPLVENGSVIPNAFMGLDLNRSEVDNGKRYVIEVPESTYVQYFEAWTGLTWEAVGPTQVTATAWTSWCQNQGWLSNQGFPAGKHRILNANNLPEPIGEWIER